METETLSLDTLRPPERNVRLHPEQQIAELARAVEMFGQTRPIVIDEENTVLAGNGLLAALQRLGRSEGEVLRVPGLSPTQKAKLMLSDNKIYSLGHDDYDGVMTLIRSLDDLDIPGFDPALLSSLISSDISAAAALEGFGRMTDEANNGTRPPTVRAIRAGNETKVRCPHCGMEFIVT